MTAELVKPKAVKNHSLLEREQPLYADQDPTEGPIMLVRRDDWQERWSIFVGESLRENIKCDWEFNSCASWSMLGVEEVTGYDFYESWRAHDIKSAADAYKALLKMGFSSLDEAAEYHFVEKPLVFANRADIVMVPTEEYIEAGMPNAMGLADPPFAWVLMSEGLGRVPLLDCTRCFAVGSLG